MIRIVGIFVVIALSTLTFLPSSFAEIERVEMEVNGMTCPFCVYGIEKKLKALPEVKDAEANLKRGMVDIHLAKGSPLDIESLESTVRDSGFSPGKTQIKAAGDLTEYVWGGKRYPALRIAGSNQIFLLVSSTPTHKKDELLDARTLNEMKKATEGGKREITIMGYVHHHAGRIPPALSVESYEVE